MLVDKIKLDNNAQADTDIDFSKTSEETNTNGLYYTNVNTEDNKTTYYFRGNVKNNYIKFGIDSSGNDILWRIVRINEDGSVRIITENIVGTSKYNESYDDNAYVGYMYGLPESTTVYGDVNEDGVFDSKDSTLLVQYFANWDVELTERQKLIFDFNFDGELKRDDLTIASQILANWSYSRDDYSYAARYNKTHANVTDSTIKIYLDNWYKNNLISYSSYIADAGFCNDRSVAPGEGIQNENDTALGYGKNITYYALEKSIQKLQLACPQNADLFTLNTSLKGNKKLTYPIGLITAAEITYAGVSNQSNENMYLVNGQMFWTMTPFLFDDTAAVVVVNNKGQGGGLGLSSLGKGVRPVINLKSDVKITTDVENECTKQNGNEDCPYIIDTNS